MICDINTNNIDEQVTFLQEEVAKIHRNPGDFGINKEVLLKDGGKDYTTAVDLKVEEFLIPKLKEILPVSSVLGEESGPETADTRFVWIVDPTDGTAVFSLGGEYYSNSIALVDRFANNGKGAVIYGSVFQSATETQFVIKRNECTVRDGTKHFADHVPEERYPSPSKSTCFPEFMGCFFGTSKYYKDHPGIEDKLKRVFAKERVEALGREYSPINARPASGSSALFCCDIADGNRHFALLFFQAAWDLAVGAVYAQKSGCPVVLFDNDGNIKEGNLEHEIAYCTKKTLINVGVFANEQVKYDMMKRFDG